MEAKVERSQARVELRKAVCQGADATKDHLCAADPISQCLGWTRFCTRLSAQR